VPLTIHLSNGRTFVTKIDYGTATYQPGANIMQGTFCYRFSPFTEGVQVSFITLSEPSCLSYASSTIIEPCPVTPQCEVFFPDVPSDHDYYDDIMSLSALGVVSGYQDGTFHPEQKVTRGQLAKVIARAFNIPLYTSGGPHFTDVPLDSTFYTYIEAAYNAGIVNGYADGTFHPEQKVTRGQLAKMVVEAAGWDLIAQGTPTFTDVPAGSTFYTYIETAAAHGVLRGYGDGTFRPEQEATRGQVARVVINSAPSVVSNLPDSALPLLLRSQDKRK
jgi:S-layer homology domain